MEEGATVQSQNFFSAVDVEEGTAVQTQDYFQWTFKRVLPSNLDIFFSGNVEEGSDV